MAAPRIVAADAKHGIAFWNNVAIVEIAADADVACMRSIGEAYRGLRDTYLGTGAGIAALVIIRAGVPVASADARAEAALFMRELGEALVHTAMVLEERGVLAQLLRSVVRGMNVLVRTARISLAEDIAEAAENIAPHVALRLPDSEQRAALLEVVAVVRSGFSGRMRAMQTHDAV